MAESSNSAPPTEEVRNLVLDEETGERVSKTELKKREKARRIAAQKAEKAAHAQPPSQSSKKREADEDPVDPRLYYENRCRTIKKFKDTSELNPFPHKYHVKTNVQNFKEQYASLKTGEERKDTDVTAAGRIMTKRSSGKNLVFYDVFADGTTIQVVCQAQNVTGLPSFESQHDHLRRGDIIGISGFPGVTNPKNRPDGDLSIFAREVILLAPCLHILPDSYYGFKDIEERFRNRWVDFIMNEDARKTMALRDDIIRYIRMFFYSRGFRDFETPILNQIAGGATAKPFTTYYNAYDQDVFLRIAPELYLKMLIVGGFNKVFEIGRLFRNEDADLTHNPEFTSCEFYQAYADYFDIMDMTEEMVAGMVHSIHGTHETAYHTQTGEELHINWAKPWRRIEMIPELEAKTGTKFPPSDQLHTDETNAFLRRLLADTGVACPPPQTNARMIDKLVGEFIEEHCINPTFIVGHPQMMSPLAKKHRDTPGLCERFEAFVGRKEIVNAYTELNDPFEQRARFVEQARQKAQGDDEVQLIDEGFLSAMEFGLPPTGGFGMGIDRMVMFLADKYSIRDVLAFPFMKPEQKGKEGK